VKVKLQHNQLGQSLAFGQLTWIVHLQLKA
jgi:hypothetical protein